MHRHGGVVLVNTTVISAGSSVSEAKQWHGAYGCLVLTAQQYASVITLMIKDVGNQRRAVKVNSGALVADGVYVMPLPAGTYEVHSAAGSSIGLYAALMPLP